MNCKYCDNEMDFSWVEVYDYEEEYDEHWDCPHCNAKAILTVVPYVIKENWSTPNGPTTTN